MEQDILIRVEEVSKKFCRELKRSLLYGVQDIISELCPLSLQNRKLRKDEFWANKEISFEVKRGQCLGLIGRNGAGKSTLLKMLNGLVKPDHGKIEMRGKIAALIELGAGFNPLLTGLENIYVNGTVLGLSRSEIDAKLDSIIEFSEVGEFLEMPVQSYSSGMRVRLGFAVAVHLEPDILLLDEILAVGDAGFRAKCFNKISEISKNAAVIFVSHFMPDVSCVSDSIIVLKDGRTQYLGQNVTEGIECYNQLFLKGLNKIEINGKARLRSFDISSSNNQQTISGGSPVTFKIEYDCTEPINNAGFQLDFLDQNQKPIAQCYSSASDLKLINAPSGNQSLEVSFRYIPFAPGHYYLSLTCLEMLDGSRRGEIYFRVERIKAFWLKDSFPGYTPVQLLGNWRRT